MGVNAPRHGQQVINIALHMSKRPRQPLWVHLRFPSVDLYPQQLAMG